MSLAIVYSRAPSGIVAPLVTVEIHLSNGLPKFNIVGLPAAAVKESRDRVRSAILNSHFKFPNRRITANLAPADLPKEGGRFDLPIAIGILVASGQISNKNLEYYEFTGELALSGELREIKGVLPIALATQHSNRHLIVPKANAEEAALVKSATIFPAIHLLEVCAHLQGEQLLASHIPTESNKSLPILADMAEVKGQLHAKRALQIAAAGKHSLLFVGPPGTGKTMLASRMPGILPLINEAQSLEVAAVASVSQAGFDPAAWQQIPFRAPHHSSSSVALVGGGRPPKPGEISLAHHGILFLDELPEYNRQVLESLREPLEAGVITISRASYQTSFPAKFQLIAAMNPCPCGYAGSVSDVCQCSAQQIQRYLAKISGPLLDRIDMQVEVAKLAPEILSAPIQKCAPETTSAEIQKIITVVKQRQLSRQGKFNSELNVVELESYAIVDAAAQKVLNQLVDKFNLSARAYHRIIKVACTISDLDDCAAISIKQIAEAANFRCLDKLKKEFN